MFFELSKPTTMASSQNSFKISKTAPKKKSSKDSASSSFTEPFLHDTTQLFSLDPMDYDESIRVMIELIYRHPIAIPLTKIHNPPIPLRLLHTAFDRIMIEDGVLEIKKTGDRIVPVSKQTFLRTIRIPEDPKGFTVQEPSSEEFQTFLNHIGYAEEFKAIKFKKSVVPGLSTVLMHLILRGLSGKHEGTCTMSKDWL